MRTKIHRLEEALAGHFGAHHAIVCRQIIDHIDFLDHVDRRRSPRRSPPASSLLRRRSRSSTSIPGISRTTAEVIIAETGADMSRFPTAGQLCAWAGVAPASYESAGKRRPAGTRHGAQWLRRTLIEAARAGARTKGSYYSAQYARIARRRGPNKAAVAVANSMLVTVWHLLTTGALYKTPAPTTSSADTIQPSRRSDSHGGSRRSGSTSTFTRRPHKTGRTPPRPDRHTQPRTGEHPARPKHPLRGDAFHPRECLRELGQADVLSPVLRPES